MNRLIITEYKNKLLTALLDDKKLVEASFENQDASSIVGNIYIGRVENIVPNINAAFVEISKGIKGYLPLDENKSPFFLNKKNTDKVCMGDLIIVQVEREPVKTKAAVLTTRISITGTNAVIVGDGLSKAMVSDKIKNKEKRAHLRGIAEAYLDDTFSIIMRTSCMKNTDEEINAELLKLIDTFKAVYNKALHLKAFTCLYSQPAQYIQLINEQRINGDCEIVTDIPEVYNEILENCSSVAAVTRLYTDPLVSLSNLYSLDSRIKEALMERVWLKSGAYLVIQPTEALIVIDVNTGKYSGGKNNREETFLKINKEAALEIAHQLRLRNYSGIILIDFIDMETAEYNRQLITTLKEAIADDPVKTSYVDMTSLGLVELTRKKVKRPLYEQVTKGI